MDYQESAGFQKITKKNKKSKKYDTHEDLEFDMTSKKKNKKPFTRKEKEYGF